jgi:2,4-dienoyl-CoA reductase-like NADH-dependent reductase (Old Yellow Enzyme family)
MLTHHDLTIPNAIEVFEEVKDTGLRFIGCKDVGLSLDKMKILFKKMKDAGMTTFLEVVTYSEEEHFSGVKTAINMNADYLIGGMPWFAKKTLSFLKDSKAQIKYFPYVGEIEGHPCILKGEIDYIINNAKEFEKLGVDGVNLLLYRYTGDKNKLLDRVTKELNLPIIVAGSVDSFEKIQKLIEKDIWAFTIGSAVLERKIAFKQTVREEIEVVLNFLRRCKVYGKNEKKRSDR